MTVLLLLALFNVLFAVANGFVGSETIAIFNGFAAGMTLVGALACYMEGRS